MSYLNTNIGIEIKNTRKEKGLTQGELAKIVGTKQSAISRFESGRYNPTIEFLQELSTALQSELKFHVK